MFKKRSVAFACAVSILLLFPDAALADDTQTTPSPTPAAQPADTPLPVPAFTRSLRRGSRGGDVAALQQRLAQLGFFTGEADGIFGESTQDAVSLFQLRHGLIADGVAGRDTFDAVFDPDAGDINAKPFYKLGKMDMKITLRKGNSGSNVRDLQSALTIKGFYSGAINGVFDTKTKSAVMSFQRSVGLKADGLAGNYTLCAVYTMLNPPGLSAISPWPEGADAYFSIPVEKLDWTVANKEAFKRGQDAVIVDIGSGYVFNVRRTGGTNHADVETLTPLDTATFYKAVGNFSWDRRPIWVITGGRRLAASMNCMPHGYDTLPDNDFRGQFCIHFVGSRTHDTDKVDPQHQICIAEAYEAGLTMKGPPDGAAAPLAAQRAMGGYPTQ